MLNIQRLIVFFEVAENAGFSKAAERLGISQPAVSRHITQLETELGITVFERRGRFLALTEAGAALLEYARRLKDTVDETEMAVASLSGRTKGELQLVASTVWEYLLPQVIASFKQQHENVTLRLSIGNTNYVAHQLRDKKAHLGFVGDSIKMSDLETLPLGEDEIVIIAPITHPLAKVKTVTPKDLDGLPIIHREPDSATAQISKKYLEQLGVKTLTLMELGSHEAIKRAVAAGLGLGMLSRYAVEDELERRILAELALDAPRCTRRLHCAWHTGRSISRVQQLFMRHAISGLQRRRHPSRRLLA